MAAVDTSLRSSPGMLRFRPALFRLSLAHLVGIGFVAVTAWLVVVPLAGLFITAFSEDTPYGPGELTLSQEYQRQARRQGILGGIAGLLVVVAIYLMVTKPGL